MVVMHDRIVVDVEIAQAVEDLRHGWEDTHEMGVAVCCIWEYQTRRMRIFGPRNVEEIKKRILAADEVIGFNTMNFDLPVIWGYPKSEWIDGDLTVAQVKASLYGKQNDLLRRLWLAQDLDPDNFKARSHGGYSLDRVAEATLGVQKIGHGALAPKQYQSGMIQEVANYCADDVALTRDLADFAEEKGYLVTKRGKVLLAPWKSPV